jgi:hypothetical protein
MVSNETVDASLSGDKNLGVSVKKRMMTHCQNPV